MTKALTIRNAGTRPEILLYGTIGYDWGDDYVSAKQFADTLAGLGNAAEIGVRINSMGGSVADGFAMYNALKENPAKIIVDVVGFAVSAASTVAMGGDEIRMHANAVMMIHPPANYVWGFADDFRKQAEVLDKLQASIAGVYASRAGKTADEFSKLMDAETWFNAEEALAAGLATAIVPNAGAETEAPAENAEDDPAMLNLYRNVPTWVREKMVNRFGREKFTNVLRRRRLELLEKATS
jgi:ATP-dependent protease ClpP protease subunit